MLKKIGLISIANAITSVGGYLLLPVYLGLMTQKEFGEFSFIVSVMGSLSLLIGLSCMFHLFVISVQIGLII